MEDYNNDDFDYKGKYIKLIAMYADKEDELTKLIQENDTLKRQVKILETYDKIVCRRIGEVKRMLEDIGE